jgi:hypothetical protein
MATGAAIGVGALLAAAGTASAISAAKVKGDAARRQYYGGSADMADAYRQLYGQGIDAGRADQAAGQQYVGQGVEAAQGVSDQGQQLYGVGQRSLAAGTAAQAQAQAQLAEAYKAQRFAAGIGLAPGLQAPTSQAELLLRANADQAAMQQMGIASAARGGNQAAAMRNAAAYGDQMRLQSGQQAAALRAQEIAQARAAMAGVAAQTAQLGLGQYQMGVDATGQGLGAQQFGAQSQLGAGQFMGELGAQREATYIGAQQGMETAQLDAATTIELARAEAQQRKKDRRVGFGAALMGAGGNVVASGYGGGGGGGGKGGGKK